MKTLIVILGPTCVGKTEFSLKMAELFSSPILNADSRQLYRDIPIGTAAPTEAELQRAKHYFVGTLGLEEYYSAAQYEIDALQLLSQLFAQRDVVVMSGGSMLYIDAVCRGIDDIPTINDNIRNWMRCRYEREGLDSLVAELQRLDPDYSARCDLKNPKRVVHALEVCHQTGRTYTSFRIGNVKKRPFNILKIGLERERTDLFCRINERVGKMLEEGLLDEVRKVLPWRHQNSLNTVGFKELFKYCDGEWELDFALDKIRRNTRVYAKKQMTWFKKDASTHWINPDNMDDIRYFIQNQIGRQF